MEALETALKQELTIAQTESTYYRKGQESSTSFNTCTNMLDQHHKNKDSDWHDCKLSPKCNTDWNGLGCFKLYELATAEERRQFMSDKKECWCCGMNQQDVRRKHFKNTKPNPRPKIICNSVVQATKCQDPNCSFGAALCSRHQPSNASKALKDWIKARKIKSTITAIKLTPVDRSFSHRRDTLAPTITWPPYPSPLIVASTPVAWISPDFVLVIYQSV